MLVRPHAEGFDVYLTRRHAKSRFMPDAFVFPGGAVDPSDRDDAGAALSASDPPDLAALTLRFAAIRELFEEAGILLVTDAVGSQARLDPGRIDALRREAGTETPFGAVLKRVNLRPDFKALTYYSNWVTPASEPIRFDAHFYLARAPEGQIAVADAVEVHDGVWLRPADALAAGERGEITLRFPTRKHLERLAGYDDLDALFAHARARNVAPVRPVERDDGTFVFDEVAW